MYTIYTFEDMIPGSFQCYQLLLGTLVVSKQKYLLTRGYTIIYEKIDR